MRPPASVAILALAPLLAACSAPSAPPEVAVVAGNYSSAFDAARDVLESYRFQLDRVDARAGVITTRAKTTSGLASPWDSEQTTLGQEWEDFINEQQRTARVTFEPVSGAPPAPEAGGIAGVPPPEPDLRESGVPLVARIDVFVERMNHSGRRLEPAAMRFSSLATDPALVDRGMWPTYAVATTQDPLLARRLAQAIRDKLAKNERR